MAVVELISNTPSLPWQPAVELRYPLSTLTAALYRRPGIRVQLVKQNSTRFLSIVRFISTEEPLNSRIR